MFENFQEQFEEWAKSSLWNLSKELNNRYGIPEAAGEFELFRQFSISKPLISTGGIVIDEDAWRIEAYDPGLTTSSTESSKKKNQPIRKTQLYTFEEPDGEDCLIACRAWIKSSGVNKSARLRLGLEREAEFFGMPGGKMTRYYEASIFNAPWQEYEVKHCLRKDKYPAKFWLNLDFYQPGTVWIKDIKLFKAPIEINQ